MGSRDGSRQGTTNCSSAPTLPGTSCRPSHAVLKNTSFNTKTHARYPCPESCSASVIMSARYSEGKVRRQVMFETPALQDIAALPPTVKAKHNLGHLPGLARLDRNIPGADLTQHMSKDLPGCVQPRGCTGHESILPEAIPALRVTLPVPLPRGGINMQAVSYLRCTAGS